MAAVELPRIVAGRYRPIRLLGRGGMGVVYEVEHIRTGQRLALKVLAASLAASPQFVQRFQREARASGQIKSEHVVTVTDADVAPELGNAPFVVMELLEGTDLEARGSAKEPPERVVGWLRQIARALDKAHRLGIVHRDLKPANLFLTSRDDGSELVKILDFGIAKMVDGIAATSTGEMVGTPAYMSPEQARGDVDITGAADRFALGLIGYRLLCGEMYWRTKTIAQLVNELLYAPLDPPSARGSTLGPEFDEWFARATLRDPGARFATVTEQVEALARALGLATLPQGDLATPAHVSSSPGASPLGTDSFHTAETMRAGPGDEPAHASSLALNPTEHTSPPPVRTPGRRRNLLGVAIGGALVVAIAVVAIVGRARVASPRTLSTSTLPRPLASVATPASSPSPPAPTPAPTSGVPDASLPPRPRPPTGAAPHPPDAPRPSTSADPFGDQK